MTLKGIKVTLQFVVKPDDFHYEKQNIESALLSMLEWDDVPPCCTVFDIEEYVPDEGQVEFYEDEYGTDEEEE